MRPPGAGRGVDFAVHTSFLVSPGERHKLDNAQWVPREVTHPTPGLCLKGAPPPPSPKAPPSTLPEGTSATRIPPPPAFPTASDCPPTDFTARTNRFVTALSLPPERPPLQANPCPIPSNQQLPSCIFLWDMEVVRHTVMHSILPLSLLRSHPDLG